MKKLPPERRLKETEEVSEYAPWSTQPAANDPCEGAATQKAAPPDAASLTSVGLTPRPDRAAV
jgi:hypothetical protein